MDKLLRNTVIVETGRVLFEVHPSVAYVATVSSQVVDAILAEIEAAGYVIWPKDRARACMAWASLEGWDWEGEQQP